MKVNKDIKLNIRSFLFNVQDEIIDVITAIYLISANQTTRHQRKCEASRRRMLEETVILVSELKAYDRMLPKS